MNVREKLYTSTSNKLLNHLDRLKDFKNGIYRPINLQLCPTNKCNLNCSFCSVKNRKDDELDIDTLKKVIDDFVDVGPILSVEISGGGDPTMYYAINELIEYSRNKGCQVGLITNGLLVKKKIPQEILNKLMWLRISLSAFDFGLDIDIPKIKGTLGFSYVWHEKSNPKVLDKIHHYAKKYKSEYVRIVPDCLVYEKQIKYRDIVNKIIKKKKFNNKLFVQTKQYDVISPCYIGSLKPCVYSDGYIYHCTATALYNRDFGKQWRIGHIKDIKKIFPKNFKPCSAKMCRKGKCFYSEHNKLLNDLKIKVRHDGFV